MQKGVFFGAMVSMIALAAYLDARGVTALIGATMAVPASQLASSVQVIEVPVANGEPRGARSFGLRPQDAVEPKAQDDAPSKAVSPWDAARCEGLAVRVIAFADDPQVSLASLWDTRSARSFVGRRGDDVGGQNVAFIGRDRVWLARGEALCQVEMYAPLKDDPQTHATAKPEITRPSAPADPSLTKGIHKNGEGDYSIDRNVVERVLSDPSQIARLAQTIPEMVDGKMIGVRLKGVRPESLLGAIGVADGDRLEKINGYELTSTEKIMEAYAHLREADRITMQINRAGKTMNLDYAIK